MSDIKYLKKVNNTSVVQQVIDSLTEAMMNKHLRPGDKIPTETELAESLGVGRNSVREAVKILVYLGVLEIRRAEGTFVCEGFSESMIDPMIYGIILNKADSYENLMELRELMEVGVMQLAIQKAEQKELDLLKERLDYMKEMINKGASHVEDIFWADNAFHDTISYMGKNPLVEKINQVVRTLTHAMRLESVREMIESGRGDELYAAHDEIYQILSGKKTEDLHRAVKNTYFTNVGLREEE